MQARIESILRPHTKSESTLKGRVSYINLLYKQVGDSANDFKWLNDTERVTEATWSTGKLTTAKTRLFHVSEFVSRLPAKEGVTKETKKYYKEAANALRGEASQQEKTNIMTVAQASQYITIDTAKRQLELRLIELFKKYNLKRTFPMGEDGFAVLQAMASSRTLGLYRFMKELQEICMLGCYIWQVALRDDWSDLSIAYGRSKVPENGNWIHIPNQIKGKLTLHLREYKTSRYYGNQIIEINEPLALCIRYFVDLLERATREKPTKLFYYSIKPDGTITLNKPQTFHRQLKRIANEILGVAASINTFRHAWEQKIQDNDEYRRMTVQERENEHAKLLHNMTTGQKYYLHRRG